MSPLSSSSITPSEVPRLVELLRTSAPDLKPLCKDPIQRSCMVRLVLRVCNQPNDGKWDSRCRWTNLAAAEMPPDVLLRERTKPLATRRLGCFSIVIDNQRRGGRTITMKLTGCAVWPKKECSSVSSVLTAFAEEVILALESRHFSSSLAQTINSPSR